MRLTPLLAAASLVLTSLALTAPASADPTPTARSSTVGLGPKISRSKGEIGGVVVLWPRVIPASDAPGVRRSAALVQSRMIELVRRVSPGVAIDVRPEPERACPRPGCDAVALGAVLVHDSEGCAVVGTVSAPGSSPALLRVWAGGLTLKSGSVPFREPPESELIINDFDRCSDLSVTLPKQDAVLITAIQEALGLPVQPLADPAAPAAPQVIVVPSGSP